VKIYIKRELRRRKKWASIKYFSIAFLVITVFSGLLFSGTNMEYEESSETCRFGMERILSSNFGTSDPNLRFKRLSFLSQNECRIVH